MPTDFLTIKEAAERFAKAEITIRRFVRTVVKQNDADERKLIQPSPAEVEKLKKKSKPFSYTISSELLTKHFTEQVKAAKQAKAAPAKQSTAPQNDYTALLKNSNDSLTEQLKVKDEQIRALNQTLDELSARQRETNILMKGLQEQLLLAAPKKRRWWFF